MSSTKRSISFAVVGIIAVAGCAGEGDTAGDGPQGPTGEAGNLTLAIEPGVVSGAFELHHDSVRLSAAENDGQLDVTVEINGAVLTALMSKTELTVELDGFVAGSGAQTQVRQTDRELLLALDRALYADPRIATVTMIRMLERSVSVWSQMSDTFSPTRSVVGESNKSWTSLCNFCGQYYSAWHTCSGDFTCTGSSDEPWCGSALLLGNRETTQSWDFAAGAWVPGVPNHSPVSLYEKGQCLGHCGAGCPPNLNQQITEDCLIHDQCVTNGHDWTIFGLPAAGWCDDEFAQVLDDTFGIPFVGSAPTCGSPAPFTDRPFKVCANGARCVGSNKLGLVCSCINGVARCPPGQTGPVTAINQLGNANCREFGLPFCP